MLSNSSGLFSSPFVPLIEKNGFLGNAVVKAEEPETSFQLYLTNKCNLNCIHCYIDSGKINNNELSTEEFLSIIDECGKISKSRVVFTGGEPLLRKDFFKLAERAKKNNLKVLLFTNGTLINERIVGKLEKNVDEIQFSLDGATPPVNDRIRGKGVFDKVLKAIQLLKNTQIQLKMSLVVMPQNFDDFKENIEEIARKLENEEMKFSLAIKEGRADNSFIFPSESEGEIALQAILRILYTKKLKAMRHIEANLISRNCGYGETITISSEGDIFPCAILKHSAGNVRNGDFPEVVKKIKNNMVESNVENLEKCPQCDLQYICFGGCRLNNITHNGNILKPYCSTEKKNDFYRKLVARDNFDGLSYWLDNNN